MTLLRCLLLLLAVYHAAAAIAHPVATPSHLPAESDDTTHGALHVTIRTSDGSQERAEEVKTITFKDDEPSDYQAGEVFAAGGSDAGGSGSAASVFNGLAHDVTPSLDQILDFFANATALPEPPTTPHEVAGNPSSSGSGSSDDVVEPTKTEKADESVFDQDAAAADKHVVPSPPPRTTASPKPETALRSAGMITTICDAAFIAIALAVIAFH